ncbi:MAG TPA: glycosyl hydrolase [Prolixibacteraceae bacterium]|nr:glycosyl hydrolase [Prolixibacteraceae bacterium]
MERERSYSSAELTGVRNRTLPLVFCVIAVFALSGCSRQQRITNPVWPEITCESKPWTRWWWMGNILDPENITRQMEAFHAAGLGGVEITPIYGVKGYETDFTEYLSPRWLEMLDHTLNEAKRLDMQVDMILGTGWPFGGPQVEPEYAASRLVIQKYPLVTHEKFDRQLTIDDPKQKDLAVVQKAIFVDEVDGSTDLTPLLSEDHLRFTAKNKGVLYVVFCAKTRQKVKRAAPGGEGYTLDHFSNEALADYLLPFDELTLYKGKLRALFNDSYEVYQADYTPRFAEAFKERRGYDLNEQLPLLTSDSLSDDYLRLVCDYRETLSDLLIGNFAAGWDQWSNDRGFKTKYQAHGSPANLIDLYARADIPECEVFGSPSYDIPGYRRDTLEIRKGDSNKMMLKFASSAAHLNGAKLISSESFTWLREHFKTALSHCKPVAEDLFLSGVNHIFLHGSTYSPAEETWPGWKFYASVNFNPTNTIWRDAPALFQYIARSQSVLQESAADPDVLLYWPVYDAFTHANPKQLLYQFNIHSIDEWLLPTSFYQTALKLDSCGYTFDFISDRFLQNTRYDGKQLLVDGKTAYKALVVPDMTHIPVETLEQIIRLKKEGASVIFLGKPKTVPGAYKWAERENQLKILLEENSSYFSNFHPVNRQLTESGIEGEAFSQFGLKGLRKKWENGSLYFLANHGTQIVDTLVPFHTKAKSALLMDALSGKWGKAEVRKSDKETIRIRIQLKPGQSLFVKTNHTDLRTDRWKYQVPQQTEIGIGSAWTLRFVEGGPSLPQEITMQDLSSWTDFGLDYAAFSGTAVYSTSFPLHRDEKAGYLLDLGEVRESARVTVNGETAGTVFAQPYTLDISPYLKDGENRLTIEVTNLPANRLSALERSGQEWKKFYEINMVNIHYQPFDASVWEPVPSGLIGPVRLVPVRFE